MPKGNREPTTSVNHDEKIHQLKVAIEQYKAEITTLAEWKIQGKFLIELSKIFASSQTVDEMFNRFIASLVKIIKVRYCALFWLNDETDTFEYHLGYNYTKGFLSSIPRIGSLMASALLSKEMIWIPDLKAIEGTYIPLNQEPAEHNVLLVSMQLYGQTNVVLRIANIDPKSLHLTKTLLKSIVPLVCMNAERIHVFATNKQNLQGMEAGFSIARLLEHTLLESDILRKVCNQLPLLFPCKVCFVVVRLGTSIKQLYSVPAEYVLSGNKQSHIIYLRNLIEAFPRGSALIPDVHKDKRWSIAERSIRSIVMAPLRLRAVMQGMIIALSPFDVMYSSAQANLLEMVAAQTSITLERAAYFRRQEDLASKDGLTGLLNHRMFQEYAKAETERCCRYNRLVSLIMFDIDHFKKINDIYGHPLGDEIIRMVGLTARSVIRASDRVFRYGGEEFCLLLPETGLESAFVIAERLRKRIEENRSVRKIQATISLGIAEFILSETVDLFIKRADAALYKSKQSGRNRTTLSNGNPQSQS